MPKYTHDCDECRFIGTYFGHDVYHCNTAINGGSIIARYGNEGHEYASQPLQILKDSIVGNGNIGGTDANGEQWQMPYQEWIFSNRSIPSTSAMIIALALLEIKFIIMATV